MSISINSYKLSTGQHVVAYLDPSTSKRIRKKFINPIAAKDYKRTLEIKYKTKGIGALSTQTISELLELHIKNCPWTRVTARKNAFVSFCEHFSHQRISNVGKTEVQEWLLNYQKKNTLSDKTMNRIKSHIGCFFTYLKDEGIIQSSPMTEIKFRLNAPMVRPRVVLSIEEVKQILENAKIFSTDVLFPYLYVIANIGARRSELIKLMREDVDFATGLIHLRKTKNGDDRSIRMSEQLKRVIQTQIDKHESDFVFPGKNDEKFHQHQVQRLVQKFRLYFPMEKHWGLHSLRHSFAYNFLLKGGEMYQLQAILGHRNIQVTVNLYGQLQAQDVEKISPYED